MLLNIIAYFIVILAFIYCGYRIYLFLKEPVAHGCAGCKGCCNLDKILTRSRDS